LIGNKITSTFKVLIGNKITSNIVQKFLDLQVTCSVHADENVSLSHDLKSVGSISFGPKFTDTTSKGSTYIHT
jgi:hypothetical protein